MTKTYTTKANARRALANIGKAALCKAAELIQEIDGQFQFDLEVAESIQDSYDCNDECCVQDVIDTIEANRRAEEILASIPTSEEEKPYGHESHGQINCPSCGTHLSNGVGVHAEEVNGKWTVHTKTHEYWCMGCGAEFGPLLPGKVAKNEGPAHPNMKTSLKLDRRIRCITTGEEFKNAYQMWVKHLTWMTTGQQDRLTAQLYAAAKQGEQLVVEINGRSFQLVNVEGK